MSGATPTVPFLDAAPVVPPHTRPCGSCVRPAAACPSTGPCAARAASSTRSSSVDLAVELTLQPVRRYGVDAAVLYSDIVVPAHAVGFGIDVAPGTGPVCAQPFRTADDLRRLRPFDAEADTPYVLETVRALATELPHEVPLLAFAGAPFTVASYLVEGRPSRTYEHTKRMIHTEPDLWHALMERLVQHAVASIASQLANGATSLPAVRQLGRHAQPGRLRPVRAPPLAVGVRPAARTPPRRARHPLRRRLRPPAREHATPPAPRCWVSTGAPPSARRAAAWAPTSSCRATSTPCSCSPAPSRRSHGTDAVLADNDGHPGHIFNLGHGVHPTTDPDVFAAVVARVHERTAR